jgi:Pyrimidine dimer DNA glycosylase
MQTFLPYPDFARSAAVLDDRRLGKQRVEALQVLRALVRPVYGWKHHPAVRMWVGYPEAVTAYGAVICAEWVGRGRADTCAATMLADATEAGVRTAASQAALAEAALLPPWLGDASFHRSHQSALVRKDPQFYGPRFPGVDPHLPYVWPEPAGRAT